MICYQASNADELSLTENEMLDVIADGDGDGWVKVSRVDMQLLRLLLTKKI